jgi:outer membrane lipoprotein-sorting protein
MTGDATEHRDDELSAELDRLGREVAPPERSVTTQVMNRIMRAESAAPLRVTSTRSWVMRGTIGLAASALVAFAVFTIFGGSASALAKALDKAAKTQTVTFDVKVSDDEEGEGPTKFFGRRAGPMRIEMPGGQHAIWDSATGLMVSFDPAAKRVTKLVVARQTFDFYSWLKDFREAKPDRVGERVVDGKRLPGFKVSRPFPEPDGAMKDRTVTMWVDPATDLPVLAEMPEGKGVATLSNLKFDVPLGDDLFKTDVPEGYEVEDLGGLSSEKLKAAAATQPAGADERFVLKPGVGLGPVKFGASFDEVVKAFGEPDEVKGRNGVDLRYPSKGFALMVDARAGLLIVNAYTRRAAGPFAVNDFAGKTDKGIAMGATRAEIEKAYGKPGKVTDNGGQVGLEYPDGKLTFVLLNDRLAQVVMMIPRRPAAGE